MPSSSARARARALAPPSMGANISRSSSGGSSPVNVAARARSTMSPSRTTPMRVPAPSRNVASRMLPLLSSLAPARLQYGGIALQPLPARRAALDVFFTQERADALGQRLRPLQRNIVDRLGQPLDL